ncbi:threonine dehydratase, partial [Pseudomonas syringae pv. actinidiae ICMP 19070]
EVVLRFEFPERPGALFNFLNRLGGRWTISMFHYRNHGAADGRVVAGLVIVFGLTLGADRASARRALERNCPRRAAKRPQNRPPRLRLMYRVCRFCYRFPAVRGQAKRR